MLPEQRRPSGGRQPTPLDTNSSPTPPANQYAPYSAPPASTRPQSYGGAPQELSTSAYDSPIAPHGSNPAAAYSSYAPPPQEDPYTAAATANSPVAAAGRPLSTAIPPQPSAPPPSAPPGPAYGQYAPYQASQGYGGGGYDAPPQGQGRPPMSPPPTGTVGYDARQTLPSHGRMGQQPPQQQGGAPQYKAYVPPGTGAGPGEGPSAPSAPGDYYEVVAR